MRGLQIEGHVLVVVAVLRWSVIAQGIASSAPGVEGTAAGELAVEAPECRMFVIGAQATIRHETGTTSSAEQWASACLFAGVFHLELAHHLEWEVRPAFAAPRIYPRAAYSRERIGILWRSLDVELDDDGTRFVFGDVETELQVAFAPEQTQMAVRMDMLRFIGGGGGSVDVFRTRVRDVLRGREAFVIELAPLALTNVALGRRGLRLDAEVGFTMGSILLRDDGDTATPPWAMLDVTTFAARTRLQGGSARLSWSGGYTRALFPTLDGAIGLEDRAFAGGGHRRGRWDLGGEGFAAATQVFAPGLHDGGLTGGVSLTAGRDLGHGLRAGASAELARTWYAVLDGAAPAPQVAARALVVLSARAGN